MKDALSSWRLPSARVVSFGSAALGGVTWLVLVALWSQRAWPEVMLLLGALVIVPLGLALVPGAGAGGWSGRFFWAPVCLQLPAAVVLLAAFLDVPGDRAALLSLPWFAVTVLVALCGLLRLLTHDTRSLADLAVSAGLLYLAVGGGWVVLARWGPGWEVLRRWGVPSLGFSDLIVLLTAVHFHYAGFVLPLLTGMVGRVMPSLGTRCAAVAVVVGVPLVAVGITLSQLGHRDFEPWAGTLLASAGLLVAGLHLRLALDRRGWPRRLPLVVPGLALLAGMTLAIVYTWGHYSGLPWVDIPEMLPYHGAVNALGFSLVGLLVWNAAPPPGADTR